MFAALRRYRRKRILRNAALPDALWRDACDALPFLAAYTADEMAGLRDLVVLFLDAKSIVGAQGHDVTPLQRTIIGIQACVPVLTLACIRCSIKEPMPPSRVWGLDGNATSRTENCPSMEHRTAPA